MIAIVIPIYKEIPDVYEQISLKRCCQVLSNYPLLFVAPFRLDISWYTNFCKGVNQLVFEKFDDSFFDSGIDGYNKLLLSPSFYMRFLNYEYILVHQLDAFVFNDSLETWCDRGYDYIGAPWLETDWLPIISSTILNMVFLSQTKIRRQATKIRMWLMGSQGFCVGNGGFSLRRVANCYKATLRYNKVLEDWGLNEDLFWSVYLPLRSFNFRIPSSKEAVSFAFDVNPSLCFALTNKKLPFGAHAWYRGDYHYEENFTFWKPIIDQMVALPKE